MMIEIDRTRYSRVKRDAVLRILEQAEIKPDKFTAHRDKTFTARYTKDRLDTFSSLRYESQMEAVDNRIAILKRPNQKMDRGRYVTLKFAVADADQLGIAGPRANGGGKHHQEAANAAILSRLQGVSRDMRQLAQYAHELAAHTYSHKHLTITLEELQKQISLLSDGLHQLANVHPN